MCSRDLPDMYTLSPRAYISGKSLMPMLQLIHKLYLQESKLHGHDLYSTTKHKNMHTVFIHIKARLKYTQGLKYTLGSAAE